MFLRGLAGQNGEAGAPAGQSDTPSEVKDAEKSAVALAEGGDVDKAIEVLSSAVESFPQRGSLRNNRAQAYRLKGDTASARADLDFAIDMENAWLTANADASGRSHWQAHKHVLQQAHTQRAILNQYVSAAPITRYALTHVIIQ